MKGHIDSYSILKISPPRPLKYIVSGQAFKKLILFLFLTLSSISLSFIITWFYILNHYGEPLVGNEPLVGSYLIVFTGITGFSVFWYLSFMHLYSVYLYRYGRMFNATVEKISIQERKKRRYIYIHWLVEEAGKIIRGTVITHATDYTIFSPGINKGDTIMLLASEKNLDDATSVDQMGLFKNQPQIHCFRSQKGSGLFTFITIFTLIALGSAAVIGSFSGWVLDDALPSKLVLICVIAGGVFSALYFLTSSRFSRLINPSRTFYTVIFFIAGFMGCLGVLKEINVVKAPQKSEVYRPEILYFDETLFPSLHFFAHVRSWRPGHLKEKIPLLLWGCHHISSDEKIEVEVVKGFYGIEVLTAVRKFREKQQPFQNE